MPQTSIDIQDLKLSIAKIEIALETANTHLEKIEEKVTSMEHQNVETRVNVGKLEAKTGFISSVVGALAGFFSARL